MRRKPTPRILITALTAALSLLLAVSALAAHPKAGKTYRGFTSAPAFNGFKEPVSFKVSRDGKRVLGFKYAGGSCLGLGGPGDPWTSPYFNYKLGPIKVLRSGTFSVKNAKTTNRGSGSTQPTTITNSTVSGRFRTAKSATGTIKYVQRAVGHPPCSKTTVHFTARTK